jgi:hypothetical protein
MQIKLFTAEVTINCFQAALISLISILFIIMNEQLFQYANLSLGCLKQSDLDC